MKSLKEFLSNWDEEFSDNDESRSNSALREDNRPHRLPSDDDEDRDLPLGKGKKNKRAIIDFDDEMEQERERQSL